MRPVAWINVAAEGRGETAYAELARVLGYVDAVLVERAAERGLDALAPNVTIRRIEACSLASPEGSSGPVHILPGAAGLRYVPAQSSGRSHRHAMLNSHGLPPQLRDRFDTTHSEAVAHRYPATCGNVGAGSCEAVPHHHR